MNLDEAIKRLEAAVKLRGENFKYQDKFPAGGCVYLYAGRPACIIGQAFEKEIRERFAEKKTPLNDQSMNGLGVMYMLSDFPQKVRQMLAVAQLAQDHGMTWGKVLEHAKKWKEENGRPTDQERT